VGAEVLLFLCFQQTLFLKHSHFLQIPTHCPASDLSANRFIRIYTGSIQKKAQCNVTIPVTITPISAVVTTLFLAQNQMTKHKLLKQRDLKVYVSDSGEDFSLPNQAVTISNSEFEEIDCVLQLVQSRASVPSALTTQRRQMVWKSKVSRSYNDTYKFCKLSFRFQEFNTFAKLSRMQRFHAFILSSNFQVGRA
jgi:hypothetical protein